MAYESHFPKFGAQKRNNIFTPVYFHAKWKNPNLYTRAVKKLAPSLAGFGLAGFAFMVFATEWRVICDNIPGYKGKFSGIPPPE